MAGNAAMDRFAPNLPSAVKKQLANADRIRENMNRPPQQGDPGTPPAAAPEAPQAPVVQQPAAPDAVSAPPAPLDVKAPAVPEAPKQPEGVQPPAPQVPQQQQQSQEVNSLRQQLTTLQGKYNAEVPHLHSQVRDITQRLQQATEENQQLRQQAQQVQAKSDEALEYFKDNVDPVYAENLANYVQGVIGNAVAPLKQEVQGVRQEGQLSRKDRFFQAIEDKHSDWKTINADPAWLQWLVNTMPPLHEETYDQALQRGQETLNAGIVNNILQTYKDHVAAGQSQQQQQRSGMVVLPGSSGGGGNPAPEKRRYRQSQIAAFYAEKRKLQNPQPGVRCMYTPEQAAALEQDIFAANHEGRIDPG